MATVVSITNPITGAVEQVDKLDHTAQQIDDAVALAPQISNPNLLDNWYFGNPVNQRGQTSWVNPSNWQYSIDRWQITPSSVVALADDGITVTADLQQALEKDRLEFGRTYTFSVLSSDGRLGKHTFVITSDTNINVSFGFGYFVCYLSGDNVWFRIYGNGSTYRACKLELGSQQTLAHQDANGNWVLNEIPDYGEQLRRCQRYCKVYGSISPSSGQPFFQNGFWREDAGYLMVTMVCPEFRTIPVVSVLDGDWQLFDGKNVYTCGQINVASYIPGVITLGIASPGNSFSGGKILALFANSGKLMLSSDL